jgi:phosphoglycerate dehydrogenase-like enzyme
MKIVIYLKPGRFDFAELARRHPDHEFRVPTDLAAFAEDLPGAEVLITWNGPFDAAFAQLVKDRAEGLKWIQFTTSGIDGALRAGGFPPGVLLSNCAGVSAPMVAEHAFALMMMVGHRLREAEAAREARQWNFALKPQMTALFGRTLCIVGLGAIGQEAARRAKGFGMRVIGVSRGYAADELVDHVYGRDDLRAAFAEADMVLLAPALSADTADMIDAGSLAAMKPGAILVNVARGELVDEDALAEACRTGRLAGAGLDVTKVEPLPADSPLWALPNVVITPHIAGGGFDTSARVLEMVDDNIRRYSAGEPLLRLVDWEHIKLP